MSELYTFLTPAGSKQMRDASGSALKVFDLETLKCREIARDEERAAFFFGVRCQARRQGGVFRRRAPGPKQQMKIQNGLSPPNRDVSSYQGPPRPLR